MPDDRAGRGHADAGAAVGGGAGAGGWYVYRGGNRQQRGGVMAGSGGMYVGVVGNHQDVCVCDEARIVKEGVRSVGAGRRMPSVVTDGAISI